jgi:hypothetical protein
MEGKEKIHMTSTLVFPDSKIGVLFSPLPLQTSQPFFNVPAWGEKKNNHPLPPGGVSIRGVDLKRA